MNATRFCGLFLIATLVLCAIQGALIAQGAPCSNCLSFTGSLSGTYQSQFQPNGIYYQAAAAGTHKGWLRGPARADFDLYLWKWNGFQWEVVAESAEVTSEEQISYYGPAGYYIWGIYSYQGSGSYTFWYQGPTSNSTNAVTLSASPASVSTGAKLTVRFEAPGRQGKKDWIGLYKTGASNYDYLPEWKETGGQTSGNFDFTAPTQAGQYEFRYLLDYGYTEAARSNTIQVAAGGNGGGGGGNGGGNGNNAPTLNRVDVTRLTLSHGRTDAVRPVTATSPMGLRAVPGFGNPIASPVVAGLLTVIASQPNPQKVTLDSDGDGKADSTNAIVVAAANIPSCFTLAVAEGLADPDGNPVAVRWDFPGPRYGSGNIYAAVAIPGTEIWAGMELTTNEQLAAYTANTLIWEAPDVGTLVVDEMIDGGTGTLTARAIDTPQAGQTARMSAPQDRQVEYARTLRAEVVEWCKERLVNGTFIIGLRANIYGNFEPLGRTWFRWALEGKTSTWIVDVQSSNQVEFSLPVGEAGAQVKVSVMASSFGPAAATNVNPFLVPLPLASVGTTTFDTSGSNVSDTASITVEHKNSCGNIIAIAAGGAHSLAVRGTDGAVFAWGDNLVGQLGDGAAEEYSTAPVQVKFKDGSPLLGIVAVAAGGLHSLALRADGVVFAWGSNRDGQVGDGSNTQRNNPVQVSNLAGVTLIAAGVNHSLAVTGGQAFSWGSNYCGELGDGTMSSRNTPVQVKFENGTPLGGVTSIDGGSYFSVAVSGGNVFAWGTNDNARIGNDPSLINKSKVGWPVRVHDIPGPVVSVAAGEAHALALTAAGTVFSWGWGSYGQLGFCSNGFCNFQQMAKPQPVGSFAGVPLTGVTAVAAGQTHSLALLGATTVVAWGRNHCGQLGDESTTTKYSPVAVSTLVGVNAIAGGKGEEATTLAWGNHSLAIAGGRVFAWGLNNRGQLGNGTRGNSSTPVRVVGL